MRCPGCGLKHPSQYDECISCGTALNGRKKSASLKEVDSIDNMQAQPDYQESASSSFSNDESSRGRKRRSKELKHPHRAGIPTTIGIMAALMVFLMAGGATVFFLTQAPKDERLLQKGRAEVEKGQYAFAVDTLSKAATITPDEPRVHLLLARAYVGINDVDKAWESISRAQQLGEGVVAEPELASDLANYYMKKKNYEKAIGLLRPLAKKDIKGKKAELADLDAAYGDEMLAAGELEKALALWEEVRDLRTGSRFSEAEARLTTIYEKLANKLSAEKKDDEAISYFSRLTNMTKNPKHYIAMADIYERSNKLELAIAQLREALKMSNDNNMQRRLATLLTRRGKELLDQGDNTTGYAYLQQAKSIDPTSSVPAVTLRSVNVGFDSSSRMPRINGEVWNPGDETIGSLSLRAELWDTKEERALWSRDQRVVDEFVRPLGSKQSQTFNFVAGNPGRFDGTVEFRMYVDGTLYRSYKLEKDARGIGATSSSPFGGNDQNLPPLAPSIQHNSNLSGQHSRSSQPAIAPRHNISPSEIAPLPGTSGNAPLPGSTSLPARAPEEHTLRDLDF